ncbi:GGDEF domain-containing protein [Ferrimonas lipolytica]|uniref:diguanylate cyclase n=2 Tax=Ferrimonas lipolytica TaxID=2724191 RepID=A0A6H1UI44_9GAMM|nr:GGDEF domain-containing protein [Ferrimonas lipolytica]
MLSQSRFATVAKLAEQQGIQIGLARQRTDGEMVRTLPLASIQSGLFVGTNIDGYLDYRNQIVVGSWRWIEELDLGLITEINAEEAYQNFDKTSWAISLSQWITNILLLTITILNWLRQAQIERFTLIDPLTEIGNRKHLDAELARILEDVKRSKLAATVMMLDIDKFKPYNDEYGHLKGDKALKLIAAALEVAVPRSTDVVTRYGGEEFCVVLPYTDAEHAKVVADKILSEVVALNITPSSKAHHSALSMSIGYYCCEPHDELEPLMCIENADKALYQAKAQRGNVAVRFGTAELKLARA